MPTILEEIEIRFKEEQLKKLNTNLEKTQSLLDGFEKTVIDIKTGDSPRKIDQVFEKMQKLKKENTLTGKAVKDTSKIIQNDFNKSLDDSTKSLDKHTKKTQESSKSIKTLGSDFKNSVNNLLSHIPGFSQVSSIASDLIPIFSRVGIAVGGSAAAIGALIAAPIALFFTRTANGADLLSEKLANVRGQVGFLLDKLGEAGGDLLSLDLASGGSKIRDFFLSFLPGTEASLEKAAKGLFSEELQKQANIYQRVQREIKLESAEQSVIQRKSLADIQEEAKTLGDIQNKREALLRFQQSSAVINENERQSAQKQLDFLNQAVLLKGTAPLGPELDAINEAKIRLINVGEAIANSEKLATRLANAINNQEKQILADQEVNRQARLKAEADFQKLLEESQKNFITRTASLRGELSEKLAQSALNIDGLRKLNDKIKEESKKLFGEITTQAKIQLEINEVSITNEEEYQRKLIEAAIIKPLAKLGEGGSNFKALQIKIPAPETDVEVSFKDRVLARLFGTDKDARDKGEAAIESIKENLDEAQELFLDAQIKRNDALISQAENNVSRLKDLAEKGSAEQLQIEEDRLNQLYQKRLKFANQQRAIAQIEIAAAKSVTIAEAIKGAISAFAKNPVLAVFEIASALASTIALIAGIKNAQAEIPAFKLGTVRVKGKGANTERGMLANIHEDERIVPKKDNLKIPGWVQNHMLPQLIADGIKSRSVPQLAYSVSSTMTNEYNNLSRQDIKEQNYLLREQNNILKKIEGKDNETKIYFKDKEVKAAKPGKEFRRARLAR